MRQISFVIVSNAKQSIRQWFGMHGGVDCRAGLRRLAMTGGTSA